MDLSRLPAVNASLNLASAVFLTLGYLFIRQRSIKAHTMCMVTAFGTSTLFLISYLTYHFYYGATKFLGQGWARPVYFTVLVSHTVLAVVIIPFVLITLFRAVTGRFARHVAIARITLPMWLYVSVTGVMIYWMLYRWVA